ERADRDELGHPGAPDLDRVGERAAGERGEELLVRRAPGDLLHADPQLRVEALEGGHELADDLALATERPERDRRVRVVPPAARPEGEQCERRGAAPGHEAWSGAIASGTVAGSEQTTPRQTHAVGWPSVGSRPASQAESRPGGAGAPGRTTTTPSSGPSTRRARCARARVAAASRSPATIATETPREANSAARASVGSDSGARSRTKACARSTRAAMRCRSSRPESAAARTRPSTAQPVEPGVAPSWSERGRCTSGSPSAGVR